MSSGYQNRVKWWTSCGITLLQMQVKACLQITWQEWLATICSCATTNTSPSWWIAMARLSQYAWTLQRGAFDFCPDCTLFKVSQEHMMAVRRAPDLAQPHLHNSCEQLCHWSEHSYSPKLQKHTHTHKHACKSMYTHTHTNGFTKNLTAFFILH